MDYSFTTILLALTAIPLLTLRDAAWLQHYPLLCAVGVRELGTCASWLWVSRRLLINSHVPTQTSASHTKRLPLGRTKTVVIGFLLVFFTL